MNYSLKVFAFEAIESAATIVFNSELSAEQLFEIIKCTKNCNYKIALKATEEESSIGIEEVLKTVSGKMFHKKVVKYTTVNESKTTKLFCESSKVELDIQISDATYGSFFNINSKCPFLRFSYQHLRDSLPTGYTLNTTDPKTRPIGTDIIHYISHNGKIVKLYTDTIETIDVNGNSNLLYTLMTVEDVPHVIEETEIVEY